MKEGLPVKVEVFQIPAQQDFYGEPGWNDELIGTYPGVTVGVAVDGQEIWSKHVNTHHIGITGSVTQNRFYERKIARAKRKAQKITKELQRG